MSENQAPAEGDARAVFEAWWNSTKDYQAQRIGDTYNHSGAAIAWEAVRACWPSNAQPKAAPAALTAGDLELCRQWFCSVHDLNEGHLERADFVLAEKLYCALGMRVPGSVADPLGLPASNVQPKGTDDRLTVAAIAMAAKVKALPLMLAIKESGEGEVTLNQKLNRDQAMQAIAALATPSPAPGAGLKAWACQAEADRMATGDGPGRCVKHCGNEQRCVTSSASVAHGDGLTDEQIEEGFRKFALSTTAMVLGGRKSFMAGVEFTRAALAEQYDGNEAMAECMRMFRRDMIAAGVIGESVPPMMMTEAILRAIQAPAVQDAEDAARFRWNYSGARTDSNALVALEIRLLNDEKPTLDEVRAAFDEAMGKSKPPVQGSQP